MRPGVYVTESVLATPVAPADPATSAGAVVAPLPSGPTSPTLVTSWYAFSRLFGNLNTDYVATFAVNSFFRAGGRELYVSRVVKSDADKAEVTLLASDATSDWLTFRAKSEGSYGNTLRIRIAKNAADLYDISVLQEAGVEGDTADDSVLETFYDLNLATFGNQEIVNVFGIRSQFVDAVWAEDGDGLTVAASFADAPLVGGSDGTSGALDYETAIDNLEVIDRNLIVFAPGVTDTETVSALVASAESNNNFIVLDTPSGYTASSAVSYGATLPTTSYAAAYYPWLWVADTTSRSRDAIKAVPPSGAVAGLYLNTDSTVGVFKAPAGTQSTLPGVVAVERTLTASELDSLNNDSSPVNAIRVIAGTGPVVMGARTLDQSKSTRYVNIRRSLLFLEREIKTRLEFALFRNNDTTLWSQMNTTVDAFLSSFWQAGGLRGAVKSSAFYVKIDRENNSAADIANGIVNIEVGVALQYPAEFIKVKLTQQTLS